jgi:hypothetical protein
MRHLLFAVITFITISATLGEEAKDPAAFVRLSRKEARWAGPGGGDFLTDASESWFVISGDVRNTSTVPLAHVKLVYELTGDDGITLASEYGYNRRAEDLRLPEYEAGTLRRADLRIPPLLPGETDSFRMLFFRTEVPRFTRWRVRVLEVGRE